MTDAITRVRLTPTMVTSAGPAPAGTTAFATAAFATDPPVGAPSVTDPADLAARRQLAAEVAHWQQAAHTLADLDSVAAPEAWAGLERYLRAKVRDQLGAVAAAIGLEATQLRRQIDAGGDPAALRPQVLRLRRRYLQAETVLDFYGDAVSTRANPRTAAVLRGLDTIAGDSLAVILRPLGIEPPPVLVYVDKGLGASILRAGVRLWDQAHPSPAAAIKITRHNLVHPTALLHETGHQVAHLTGWTGELADALGTALVGVSRELAATWQGWASEVAADVHAFAQAGWAPLPALANVVDGTSAAVYRLLPGDPHPFAWIRVMFNAALCRSWFGAGPWDGLARIWWSRHPPHRAPPEAARLARASIDALGLIVDVCTRQPMAAFGGRPLAAVADPRIVSPAALAVFARQAGPSLLTSTYLRRIASLRILAWLTASTASACSPPFSVGPTSLGGGGASGTGRAGVDDARDEAPGAHSARLTRWLSDLGADGSGLAGAG
ncbi:MULTISPECIES: hypothetical protein [unclassified Pseudofrankia]|uniref:hypothetical protein n=1 Tax=unclassified Pseudofrankia TaxID=2994372 RepID=UPI0008DAAEFD|nr:MULTISPECIES: hypothetical protein [unclassified Pseudofrankia]MDT3439331.1 hypothetical protein [Pseudofrankia sp. BMG5.37]